jgi:hypothetical protein
VPAHRLLADFVANDTTYGSTTDCSRGTATGKYGTSDGANASPNRCIFVLRRHSGARTQAKQHRCGQPSGGNSHVGFHGISLISNLWSAAPMAADYLPYKSFA